MRIEKYVCDFCKKEFPKEKLENFYTDKGRFELCEDCYKKASKIRDKYQTQYKIICDDFQYDIDQLKNEDR